MPWITVVICCQSLRKVHSPGYYSRIVITSDVGIDTIIGKVGVVRVRELTRRTKSIVHENDFNI